MINEYLEKTPNLKCMILILDIRHDPTAEDKQMAEWIRYYQVPVVLAVSKSDKLGKTRVKPQAAKIRKQLGFSGDIPVVPYSAVTKQGVEELLEKLDRYIIPPPPQD